MTSTVYLRRAWSLALEFSGNHYVVTNFLTKSSLRLSDVHVDLLRQLAEWTAIEDLFLVFSEFDEKQLKDVVKELVVAGALVARGSHLDLTDEKTKLRWKEWGVGAAWFHYSIKDPVFLDEVIAEQFVKNRNQRGIAPLPFLDHKSNSSIEMNCELADSALVDIMRQRRTCRSYNGDGIHLDQISTIVFTGCGVLQVAISETYGPTVYKMTPSGGARNPYEAFVVAKKIVGLSSGCYHYSAINHTFRDLSIDHMDDVWISKLVAGQGWSDRCAAAVILVANFDRTMWKYSNSAAYRVVLIEAGHIAQNMVLTATSLGVSSATTAAIDDAACEHLLGLDMTHQAVVYVILLGMSPNPGGEAHFLRR